METVFLRTFYISYVNKNIATMCYFFCVVITLKIRVGALSVTVIVIGNGVGESAAHVSLCSNAPGKDMNIYVFCKLYKANWVPYF